jgi:hypothetical protein
MPKLIQVKLMNNIMRDYYPMFEEYQALRNQLVELLSDSDLSFRPSEANLTLGALCREIGETQVAYIYSFKTLKSDFSYRHKDSSALEASVVRLRTWFSELDHDLKQVVADLSDNEIQSREIEHGKFSFPISFQLTVYAEALIIFYGKVSIYLRAMGTDIPKQWRDWIG